jgi:hypothetical protein
MARTKQQKTSGRRLTGTVHLPATEDREAAVYGPDDDVPAEDAERITNPFAWEGEDDEDDDEDGNAHIRQSSIPRRELVKRAKELDITFGSGGLPKNASDAVIAAAIRQKEGRQTGAQPAGTIDPQDLDLGDGNAPKVEDPEGNSASDDGNGAGA